MFPTNPNATRLSPRPPLGGAPLRAALALALALAAAAACSETSGESDNAVGGQSSAIHEPQGMTVLGTSPATLSVQTSGVRLGADSGTVSVAPNSANLVFTMASKNTYSGLGAQPDTKLKTSNPTTLVIARACRHYRPPAGWQFDPANAPQACDQDNGQNEGAGWTVQPNEYEYEVRVQNSAGVDIGPLCSDGWNRAIPMRGTWSAQGAHNPAASNFSFACNGSTARKCSDWGYKPWASTPVHQACTRMARADYCGDNRSHTFENTPIDLFDWAPNQPTVPPINSPAADPAFSFEAGWRPDGAVCLSKQRWQILPIGHCSAGGPPDPRVTGTKEDYCDTAFEAVAMAGNVPRVLLNNSGFYEAGLYTWKDNSNPANPHYYTTTKGFYGGEGFHAPGDSPADLYDSAEHQGIIFRQHRPGTVKLRACASQSVPTIYVTTTAGCPADFDYPDDASKPTDATGAEGFIFISGAPPTGLPNGLRLKELKRYCKSLASVECMTTTATSAPVGFPTLVRTEGLVLATKP